LSASGQHRDSPRTADDATTRRLAEVFALLRPFRWRILGLLGLTLILSVLAMLPPLVSRAIIDRVITRGEHNRLAALAVLMLSLPILNALIGYLQTIGIAYVGQRYVFDLRQRLYERLLRLSLRYYSRHSVGMLVNRLMGDTGTVQTAMTAQTIGVVSDFVSSAFAIVVTFALNWRMATLLVIMTGAFVLNFHLNIVRIRRSNRSYRRSMDRLSSGLQNRLTGSLSVKSYGTESREHGEFQSQSVAALDQVRAMTFATDTFSRNTELMAEAGRATIYFLGCGMVLSGRMSYGDVLAFTSYAMQLLWPVVRFSMLAKQAQDLRVAADRIFDILHEQPEIADRPGAVAIPGRLRGAVEFDRVEFHYEAGRPVIRGLSLTVRPGETIALIGPTGCGKTTLLSLLMRFFDVQGGAIRLDGRDVRDYRLRDLRRQFGIVLQEPLLFTTTIAENIRYARRNATPTEIETAARVAEIHDFIAATRKGYQTVIGEEGLQLSVGQKQRIAIARAVLANPAILIMDEATSALDSESERAIQRAMERVLHQRTAFIVAHRLSTIRNASRILLLKDGLILEEGSHSELMARNGRYAAIYRKFMGRGALTEAVEV